MSVSIREVAELAGVSIGTVSNVLNRPDLVADATAVRVHEAIVRTGYVPNASARQLRVGSAPQITVVVPDISNPFFADVARRRRRGPRARSRRDDRQHRRRSRARGPIRPAAILEQRPAGVLITPAGSSDASLDAIAERVPVVLVDRHSDGGHCSVAIDDVRGAGLAVDHIARLGHRAITWVVGPDSIPQCAERTAGVMAAAAERGLSVDTLRVGPLTVAAGRSSAAGLESGSARPTAILCANDLLALGVEFALLEQGVDVPGEVSVVGFDDIEFGAAAAVPLTSVARPGHALGATALALLLDERADPAHEHRHVRFDPTLQIRRSSGPPRP